jgi:hypothetical protein
MLSFGRKKNMRLNACTSQRVRANPELFSDLASENSLLLASLASASKEKEKENKLSTPLLELPHRELCSAKQQKFQSIHAWSKRKKLSIQYMFNVVFKIAYNTTLTFMNHVYACTHIVPK